MEALQQKQDAVKIKLHELKSSSDEVWGDLRAGTEKAWAELKIAFDKTALKFK